jgi:ankyrin repeat protein
MSSDSKYLRPWKEEQSSIELIRELSAAARGGDLEGVTRLLTQHRTLFEQRYHYELEDSYISLLNEMFYRAATTGNVAMVELFLRHGADINQPRHVKTGEGVVERLASDDANHAIIEWLLIHGAKLSHVRDGRPVSDSLISAAIGGSLRIVRSLVEHGAPING